MDGVSVSHYSWRWRQWRRARRERVMKKGLAFAVLAAVALAAGGCTNNPQTNKELQCAGGVLGGAAIGGLLGNQIGGGTGKAVATAVGAGAGAAVGTQTQACK